MDGDNGISAIFLIPGLSCVTYHASCDQPLCQLWMPHGYPFSGTHALNLATAAAVMPHNLRVGGQQNNYTFQILKAQFSYTTPLFTELHVWYLGHV